MFHQHASLAVFALFMQAQLFKGVKGDGVVLINSGLGIKCVPGSDISEQDCAAAGQSVGGQLRKGDLLVGSWADTPYGCFLESSDMAIHYGRNGGGHNNGNFQSVCSAAEKEVTVLDAYKGSECVTGHDFSKEECVDAATAIGGVLKKDALQVGAWAHIPYGCSIQDSDKVIHFGTNIAGTNAGQFQPVCVTAKDRAFTLPAREGTSCDRGSDFNEHECVDAALSIGGKLRDGKVMVGIWGDAPNACFLEESDKAIHYNKNGEGVNRGSFNPVCKVGAIKATLLPAIKGSACAAEDEISLEDCAAAAMAIGGELRYGSLKIGVFYNGPPGCFIEESDKAIHYGTDAGSTNNGFFQPVCVARIVEATVLPDSAGSKCTPGYDFTEQECLEAAKAVGGRLRKNKYLVGDWANTPSACFMEHRDMAIHYGHRQGAVNNGYFHPVCKPGVIEATLKPAERDVQCRDTHNFSQLECVAAAKSVGGQLRNNEFIVGDYTNAPFGCFIDPSDAAIHYGREVSGVNIGTYQSVCKKEAEEAAKLPGRKGTQCSPGENFASEDCIAAGESLGGNLRGGNILVGAWADAPYGCFLESRDNAIHFNTNAGGTNNGSYEPVCIYV